MVVSAQEPDGERAQVPLTDVAVNLGSPRTGSRRIKVSLDLNTLRPSSTAGYLFGLGLQTLEPGGQAVYEADFEGGKVVIPAQLLIAELVAPNAFMREALLTPWGPSHLMSVFADDYHGLQVIPTPRVGLKSQVHIYPTTAARLEWMLCYPSGHAAWCSVYRHALNGQLNMALPNARVDMTVQAHRDGERLLVTQLTVKQLQALEEPFEFAHGLAAKAFVFNAALRYRPTHRMAAAPTRDAGLQSNGLRGPMTNAQWERVDRRLKALLVRPGRPGCAPRSLREVIDVILLKLGTPYSWSKVPAPKRLVQSASTLLSQLKRGGIWEHLVEEISRD